MPITTEALKVCTLYKVAYWIAPWNGEEDWEHFCKED